MSAQIVSFHCVLMSQLGQVLSSSYNQDVINQLENEGNLSGELPRLRGLIAGIQNVRAGEHRKIQVPARDAYGPYDPALVVRVPRFKLSDGERLEVGSVVRGRHGAHGQERSYRVTEIEGRMLVLDGNHPLAGQDLVFEIEVTAARDANSDDLRNWTTSPSYLH